MDGSCPESCPGPVGPHLAIAGARPALSVATEEDPDLVHVLRRFLVSVPLLR